MKRNLVGSHRVLTWLPLWLTMWILFMSTIGMMFLSRDMSEGLFYNTSYSAMLGDGALLAAVLMAAEMLRKGVLPPLWSRGRRFHFGAVVVAVLFGFMWWAHDRPQQWADCYHHLVIAPLIAYLAITLLPIILAEGTRLELVAIFAWFWFGRPWSCMTARPFVSINATTTISAST